MNKLDELLSAQLTRRTCWDDLPELGWISLTPTAGWRHHPIPLPDLVWQVVNPVAILSVIAATPSILLTTPAPHGICGIAWYSESWGKVMSEEEVETRRSHQALGIPVPEIKDMPDRIEQRMITAVVDDGHTTHTRVVTLTRGHDQTRTATAGPGRVPTALHQLMNNVHHLLDIKEIPADE